MLAPFLASVGRSDVAPSVVRPVGYLHRAFKEGDGYRLETIWGTDRDPNAMWNVGHNGVLIGSSGRGFTILHRSNYMRDGRVVEFDCEGRLLRSHSEAAMATGDPIPALDPRTRGQQWTAGIAVMEDGFLIPLERYYSELRPDVDVRHSKTEVFHFRYGEHQGSIMIPERWAMMDYEPGIGVILSTRNPSPHFIIVPAEALTGRLAIGDERGGE